MRFICFVSIFMKNKNDEDYCIVHLQVTCSFSIFFRSWSELTDIRLNRVRVNEVKLRSSCCRGRRHVRTCVKISAEKRLISPKKTTSLWGTNCEKISQNYRREKITGISVYIPIFPLDLTGHQLKNVLA